MKKLIYIYVAAIAFSFVACENNEQDIELSPDTSVNNVEVKETDYNIQAQSLALVINKVVNENKEFKELIYTEAQKQFDGYYDVLLTTLMSKEISQTAQKDKTNNVKGAGLSVRDLLESTYLELAEGDKLPNKTHDNSTIKKAMSIKRAPGHSMLEEIVEAYPELQVSVPIHIEQLDDANYIPPVAFISEEFYVKETDKIIAYKGEEILLYDREIAPDDAVIAIGLNERAMLLKELQKLDLPDDNVDVPTPNNLACTTNPTNIYLKWESGINASSKNISGYYIERKDPGNNNFNVIDKVFGYDNTVYFDSNLAANKVYAYRVKAFYTGKSQTYVSSSSNIEGNISSPTRLESPNIFKVSQPSSSYLELRWANPVSFSGKTNIYKQQLGVPAYVPLKSFEQQDTTYLFDSQIKGGETYVYAIENEIAGLQGGVSNRLYDFIHVSHRDPAKQSPIRIKTVEVKGTVTDIESWIFGPPEFILKVIGANKKDKTTFEIREALYIDLKGTAVFGWKKKQDFDIFVYDWPYSFESENYDIISFFLTEYDVSSAFDKFMYSGKIGYKGSLDMKDLPLFEGLPIFANASIGSEHALEMEYNFLKGKDLGRCDYYYYEPVDQILEFTYKNAQVDIKLGQ